MRLNNFQIWMFSLDLVAGCVALLCYWIYQLLLLDFCAMAFKGKYCVHVQDETILQNERCGICMDIIIDRGVLDCCNHWYVCVRLCTCAYIFICVCIHMHVFVVWDHNWHLSTQLPEDHWTWNISGMGLNFGANHYWGLNTGIKVWTWKFQVCVHRVSFQWNWT